MTDVIKLAQDKRAKHMAEVERLMAEIERLDNFILFGAKLSAEAAPVIDPDMDLDLDLDDDMDDDDASDTVEFAAE